MKKAKYIIMLSAVLLCFFVCFPVPAFAAQSTTYTYSISVDGRWIRTQDAYIPSVIYMRDAQLNQPNDLFVKDGKIYVADTGNKRLAVFNKAAQVTEYIENDLFQSPSGVFVNDKNIFVADPDAEAVFILDLSGSLSQIIKRPENSLIMSPKSIYRPMNVVAATDGNIYVVGEGAYEGLMQFDAEGIFKGYFAANKRYLSLLDSVRELLFTREQKKQLLSRTPRAIQNIDINDRDLVYSVTQSAEVSYAWSEAETKTSNALKLHNLAGTNIMSTGRLMDDEWNFVDVAAGQFGNSYALTYTGLIYEYDSEGNLIFSFGGRAVSNDRYGLFTFASAIDLDEQGFIYVLDKERGLIQVFAATDFAVLTHKAIHTLETGKYEESEEIWKDVLQLNGMSRIAHMGYGKSLFRQQEYHKALEHFKIAGQKSDYSEAFWEIRNEIINKNIIWLLIAGFAAVVFGILRRIFRKPKKAVSSAFLLPEAPAGGVPRLKADLKFSFTILRHPIDSNYYIKANQRGSLAAAVILLIIQFAVYLSDIFARGFLFNMRRFSDMSPLMISLLFFITFILFVGGNYMVSTINEGEGSLREIFVVTVYSLVPYMLCTPVVVGLSYILTINEIFVTELLWMAGIIWSGALNFIGIMQTHNYSFKAAVKNIIITALFIILALVVAAIVYLVWDKVFDFIKEIFMEVAYLA